MKINCVFCSKDPRICPIHAPKFYGNVKEIKEIREFSSVSPPSVFIGSKLKYPSVNIGVLSPPEKIEEAWLLDSPNYWAKNEFDINEIVSLRKNLINSRKTNSAKALNDSYVELLQEIGMSVKPVDINVELNKSVKMSLSLDNIATARGPSAELKKINVNENIRIHSKVDKVVSDSDLKAVTALEYLYKSGFNEQQLSQLLSIGVLGIKDNRRLVPTRLSITATDDILGKKLLKDVRDYKEIENYRIYFNGYLGNYYLIMFIPNNFSYELFETYLQGFMKNFNFQSTTDYESYFGRKNYALQTAGGYYSVKLAILEELSKIKRKASVITLRFITPAYTMPLRVFVTREAARKSLNSEYREFNNIEEMLEYAKVLIYSKFKFKIDEILKKSKLLNDIKTQKRISNYF